MGGAAVLLFRGASGFIDAAGGVRAAVVSLRDAARAAWPMGWPGGNAGADWFADPRRHWPGTEAGSGRFTRRGHRGRAGRPGFFVVRPTLGCDKRIDAVGGSGRRRAWPQCGSHDVLVVGRTTASAGRVTAGSGFLFDRSWYDARSNRRGRLVRADTPADDAAGAWPGRSGDRRAVDGDRRTPVVWL